MSGPGRGARSEQPGGRLDVRRGGARTRAGRARASTAAAMSAASYSQTPWATSSGTSRTTAPGRPLVATAWARRTQLGDARADLDAQELLDRRAQQPHLLGLLRHPLARVAAVRVADDRDHGRAGVGRLDEPRDEVGGAGPERRVADADAPRRAGVGVCGEGRGALVVDQDVARARGGGWRRTSAAAGSRPSRRSGRSRAPRASAPGPRHPCSERSGWCWRRRRRCWPERSSHLLRYNFERPPPRYPALLTASRRLLQTDLLTMDRTAS